MKICFHRDFDPLMDFGPFLDFNPFLDFDPFLDLHRSKKKYF